MPPFETRHSKMKMFWLCLASLAFVSIGVWMIMSPETFQDGRRAELLPYAAWLCVIFFGFGLLVGLYQMFNSKTQIRADENGIYAAKLSSEIIPWSVIDGVDVKEMRMGANPQVFFVLHMSPDAERQIRFSRAYRMTKSANKAFGYHGPHFTLNGMIDTPNDIANEVGRRFQYYKG